MTVLSQLSRINRQRRRLLSLLLYSDSVVRRHENVHYPTDPPPDLSLPGPGQDVLGGVRGPGQGPEGQHHRLQAGPDQAGQNVFSGNIFVFLKYSSQYLAPPSGEGRPTRPWRTSGARGVWGRPAPFSGRTPSRWTWTGTTPASGT